jgi:hypothetical protein
MKQTIVWRIVAGVVMAAISLTVEWAGYWQS